METERKSNSQLKRLIEQKEQKETGKQPSTGTSGPCTKCAEMKKLLDIEKENNLQLTEQIKLEQKQTEEERNAKEVNILSKIFPFIIQIL